MNKIIKNNNILAFLISIIFGSLIILPNIIINHGIFTLSADFNYQQIPFNEIINYSLKEGSFLWSWYNELGSNFVGTYSFYNLFSPFSLIGYCVKTNIYPYLCGYLIILKFGFSGLTSYLFLSRYVKNKKYAILGSLLYSFSGYQLNNLLFHFQDSICLFPLIPYTLDNLMYDKKENRFCLAIFLLCITNWFMFIGECVFIFIYLIIKLILKEYKFKNLKQFIIEFTLGILLSSFVLLPSLIFTTSNPRINTLWTIKNMLIHPTTRYIEITRSMISPNEVMYPRAFLTNTNYDSVEFYLPFIGIVLITPYIIKKSKSWLSILLIILIIFMFIPILNSSFFAFKTHYYARWFYMATLVGSLISIKTIEDNYKINSGIITSLLGLGLITLIYIYLSYKYPNKIFIFDPLSIKLIVLFTIINLISIYVIFKLKIKKRDQFLLAFTCIFIVIWGNYTVYKYSETGLKYNQNYNNYINSFNQVSFNKIDRAVNENCGSNIGNILKVPTVNSFNTNINGTNFEFYSGIDYERDVFTNSDITKNLNNFLSVKYIITCDENTNNPKIKENSNFQEMGIVLNNYINKNDFKLLETNEKYKALNNYIVLSDEQIKKYKYLYNNKSTIISNNFQYVKNGFKSNITVDNDTLILYTVPYDLGWRAMVNNKQTTIEKVDNGLMAIKINKGENKIEFKYYTPGLNNGLIISFISLLTYIILLLPKKSD